MLGCSVALFICFLLVVTTATLSAGHRTAGVRSPGPMVGYGRTVGAQKVKKGGSYVAASYDAPLLFANKKWSGLDWLLRGQMKRALEKETEGDTSLTATIHDNYMNSLFRTIY
uniref:Uncharacterized protein n=1 Tax=Plectus sambesii TaxID=2011161 RepID=A0A914V4M2_9BILA